MVDERYTEDFSSCILTTDPTKILELKRVCHIALTYQSVYQQVEKLANIPWWVIAAIHFRESSQSFKCHLHNGDPLTERTIQVPAGRPIQGAPPFTWQASAIDALTGFWRPFRWDMAGALEFCERYNGLGYLKRGGVSPYIWSYTNKYVSGLFIADGKLDMTRKDARPGVAALFKTLIEWGRVSLDFTQLVSPDTVFH